MYTIKAIPTFYNGIQFRSRLEAKWAAFFDLAGWPYQYEPFDLDGWIPDFLLGSNVLVEVKPVTAFPRDVADEVKASYERSWSEIAGSRRDSELETILDDDCRGKELLILGCQVPIIENDVDFGIGWLLESCGQHWGANWEAATLGDWDGKIDFCHTQGSFCGRVHGGYCGGSWGEMKVVSTELVNRMWREAGNLVQWKPPHTQDHASSGLLGSANPKNLLGMIDQLRNIVANMNTE